MCNHCALALSEEQSRERQQTAGIRPSPMEQPITNPLNGLAGNKTQSIARNVHGRETIFIEGRDIVFHWRQPLALALIHLTPPPIPILTPTWVLHP